MSSVLATVPNVSKKTRQIANRRSLILNILIFPKGTTHGKDLHVLGSILNPSKTNYSIGHDCGNHAFSNILFSLILPILTLHVIQSIIMVKSFVNEGTIDSSMRYAVSLFSM